MDNIEQIKARLDAQGRAMTILNMSTVVPGERIVDYRGCAETLSTRIKRFNLGLVDLSERTGLPIVDVDARVARMGADRVKIDALHLTPEGCRVIAEEVLQVLIELGHLTKPAASPCA
ncbi:MAG: hypothetical protein ABI920_15780 [Casimicrobiaceae bacterium]